MLEAVIWMPLGLLHWRMLLSLLFVSASCGEQLCPFPVLLLVKLALVLGDSFHSVCAVLPAMARTIYCSFFLLKGSMFLN